MKDKPLILLIEKRNVVGDVLKKATPVVAPWKFFPVSKPGHIKAELVGKSPFIALFRPLGYSDAEASEIIAELRSFNTDIKICILLDDTDADPNYWYQMGIFEVMSSGFDERSLSLFIENSLGSKEIQRSQEMPAVFHENHDLKKMENNIRERDIFLRGVLDATNALMTIKNKDESFNQALKALGLASTAGRVYLMEFKYEQEDKCRSYLRYEWTNGIISADISNPEMQGLEIDKKSGGWFEKLNDGFVWKALAKDFQEAARALLESQHIRAVLMLPLFSEEKKLQGAIGFDYCNREEPWSDTELTILKSAAADFSAAIIYRRMEEELRKLNQSLEQRITARVKEVMDESEKRKTTEYKLRQAYDTLCEQLEFQQKLMDTIPVPIFFKNKFLEYIDCNSAMCEFLRRNKADVIGKTLEAFREDLADPATLDKVIEADIKLMQDGKFTPAEISVAFKDGITKTAVTNKARYYDNEGNVAGIIGGLLDITEQKKAEKLSELRLQQLMQSDKLASLGRLIAGVAHEINNPSNFITMNIPILKELWANILPELKKRYDSEGDFQIGRFKYSILIKHIDKLLSGINDGANRIRNIIAELKNYAKPDKMDFDNNLDINEIIEDAVGLLKNTIKSSNAEFNVLYGSGLPHFTGSAQKVEQVIINLVNNACDALSTERGVITVKSEYYADRNMLAITVEDNGCGIAENDLTHVVEPFFTTKREKGGTGLGLSISLKIIEMHGGNLEFKSELGKGTKATILLPII